ncbi:zinc finger protein 774 isoform X2 [Nilaparvata lugens]|uniref:zinc finger protein 774 isoform X2 n=1 Tax=Nilaparvata lugens TaxID=108931 RepID=UPI00193D810B|nr:zinc finger protein 774 isoform X2 [Nilaparvata lugens]
MDCAIRGIHTLGLQIPLIKKEYPDDTPKESDTNQAEKENRDVDDDDYLKNDADDENAMMDFVKDEIEIDEKPVSMEDFSSNIPAKSVIPKSEPLDSSIVSESLGVGLASHNHKEFEICGRIAVVCLRRLEDEEPNFNVGNLNLVLKREFLLADEGNACFVDDNGNDAHDKNDNDSENEEKPTIKTEIEIDEKPLIKNFFRNSAVHPVIPKSEPLDSSIASESLRVGLASHNYMEFDICGRIAFVCLHRLEDEEPNFIVGNLNLGLKREFLLIEIVKHESPFEQIDIEMKNEPSHSNTAIHQMATVAVDSSQEPAPECSTAFAPTDNDISQQQYSIPGYNLIFIKEEDYQDGEDISEEVDFGTVKSEAEMGPSISGTANATEVGGLDAHSISPVEKCTEPTVAGKETKLYSCADCSYETPWIAALKRHIRRHTWEKPFSCEFCDFKFATSANLKVHIRKHTGEKPFTCEFCDYKCASSGHLKVHIRTHTGEKPFSCEFCDFKFATSGNLKEHIKSHTGEKLFNCEFCDYTCSRKYNFKLHLRKHTGEKPFSCEFCDYRCAFSGHLKEHIRSHTGEKPFSCEFCDYKCASSSHLKVHIRTHTGEKPFSCESCDYKCATSGNLKVHIRTHTG